MTAIDTDRPTDRAQERMLYADDFTFEYPTADEPALSNVSFDASTGDVLGMLGPVEAGKTTLAMALASFAPQNTGGQTHGDLEVAGRDPRDVTDNEVAMVFEDYASQLTQVRVIDEVVAPLINRGLSRSEALSKARELLDTVRLADVEEKFTWDLSGGQQQRLAIAAALAIDPEVLVFDTATDMLDPEGREDVANLIASLAGTKTLVVTTNDPDELVGIADEVLVLDGGERVAFDSAETILRDEKLLREVGVDPPLCLDVANQLGMDAAPLTPREFADCLDAQDGLPNAATQRRVSTDGGDRPPQTTSPRIDVDAASYEYADGTVAVDEADVHVSEGEVHAVIGGNGAGKSTFSKLLVGLLNPDAGHVTVSGTSTDDVSARDMATSIGIALQNPDEQLSEQTVEEELRFPLEQRQYTRTGFLSLSKEQQYSDDYIDDRSEDVCDLVGIDDAIRKKDPMFLPRGQQRLVTIALAVAPDPDAVVLDEPTAGLDAANRSTVEDTIERLTADGKAVVLIDHDMDFICDVADRVSVLSDGEVVMQGPTQAVFAQENWDWLMDHHMRPPRVARLARELGVDALTTDGLVDKLAADLEEAV